MAALFDHKKILIGVSGGIAGYKTCELVRELRRQGAEVRVMMTPKSQAFVSALTFAALSENPVLTDMFPVQGASEIEHIDWSRWPETIVVCPATANTIARVANGFADEPVSATIRATKAPVIICPAMNSQMWEDEMVRRNVETLKNASYRFVDPEFGALATTSEGSGWGRLARLDWIMSAILAALQPQSYLSGKRILITAGRTEEFIDPVRMITNPSTGRMGFALAQAAVALGGEVTLVHGPSELPPPFQTECVPVVSAAEMRETVLANYRAADILIMSAAVSDFRPKSVASEKIKKDSGRQTIELERTEDILQLLGERKNAVHVGFAVETENVVQHGIEKLRKKNLDLIVVNNPKEAGSAFAKQTNKVTLIDRRENREELPLLSKLEVAFKIFEKLKSGNLLD